MSCPSCSAPVPEGARFCPGCGQPLQVRSDERRVVTVLIGDLVGFTALAETRDPEQVKNLVDRCFERLTADIATFGGRLDKIVGDAVIALFGAPVAHEDDAERAVRAGLQMQRTLDEHAAALDADIRMRIGINTGEVLVGALRAGGDYTAMGDVVNTASRLQTLAAPGQVVVGAETHQATRHAISYEPLGQLTARGREEPVEAWCALEPTASPGRRRRRARTPLVGRDAELGMLCHAVGAAIRHGRPQLALVLGEAGMGKSRLAEEVAGHARDDHGAVVLAGRSVPYGEANVWWPLAEAFREACGVEPSHGIGEARERCLALVAETCDEAPESAEAQRITDSLLYLMGYTAALSDVDPARARDEVALAVRAWIEGAARRSPVLLWVADVQWADPLVLELVDGLLDRLPRLPVTVLLTARPEVEERWRPAPGRHNLLVLNLDPLDASAAGELLSALLEHEPRPDLRELLVERSGGNPFFLEELVALLCESGALATAPDAAVLTLPATLRGLVAARLDGLSAAERAVLEDAAVVGRRSPLPALGALAASRGDAAVDAVVDALVAKDLLILQDGHCAFRSDLIREVAYGILTKAERARRHAALAGWLDGELPPRARPDEALEEVARHFATAAELVDEVGVVEGVPADVRERALTALERAAERSEEREAHLVAARLHDQTLRLLGPDGGPRRRRALIGRARAGTALRRSDEARAAIEAALAEAREAGDEVAVAAALTVRGELEHTEGSFKTSLATLDEAVERWRVLGDRRGEASALRRRGMTHLFAGDTMAAEESLLEALTAFQEIGARKGVAWANQNLAWIAFVRNQLDLAEERLRDSIDLFADIGDWGGMSWALGLLGWVRYTEGDTADAERLAVQAIGDAGERGDRWGLGMMTVLLSSVRLWQGRTAEAVELGREARRVFDDIGDTWGECRSLAPLSRALLMLGRREEAEEVAEEARRLAHAFPALEGEHDLSGLVAAGVAVHAGDGARALDMLPPIEAGLPITIGGAEYGNVLGLALLQSGLVDESMAVLDRVLADVHDVGPRSAGLAAAALARAAAGRVEQARAALDELAELGAGTYLDHTSGAMAEAALAARAGDATAAQEALDRAEALVAPTDDRLSAAVLRLARARVAQALGAPDACDALDDADRRLAEVSAGRGWDTVLSLAAGVTPAVEAPGAG